VGKMSSLSPLTEIKKIRRKIFSVWVRKVFLKHEKNLPVLLSIAHISRMRELLRESALRKFYLTREDLFDAILAGRKSFVFLEFGVSEGRLTEYFFMKHKDQIEWWHGFDTFTGLPEPWGDLPIGTFSTGGKTPDIAQKNITWYVGKVEDFQSELESITSFRQKSIFLIFDLDLYSPSKTTWSALKDNLKSGDILFFDEAFYFDERNLIDEILQDYSIQIQYIGYTIFGVAFEIV
jgi:hypothetical protein